MELGRGTKQDLLSAAVTGSRPADNTRLAGDLADAGLGASPSGGGSLHTLADLHHVGEVALAAGVALTELRSADSAGLEEMFLKLTAESQRDSDVPEGGAAA